MIKQFNFYDIYGYLLPGMLLLALFWVPLGILTQSWPDQDLSKALFLAALAYIIGHMLQTVANAVVPSTVKDDKNRPRFPSEFFLDKSNSKFTDDFKTRLSGQVTKMFGLDLAVAQDGDGKNKISGNRQAAFFQARSYLLAKKSANYVEQFEGLYAMMRGLTCSFLAGSVYLAGWGLSFHKDRPYLPTAMAILLTIGLAGASVFSCVTVLSKLNAKKNILWLAIFLLVTLLCSGFWASLALPSESWRHIPAYAEYVIWASSIVAFIAAARCFSSYRAFAGLFALTVWSNFSAYLSFQAEPMQSSKDDPAED